LLQKFVKNITYILQHLFQDTRHSQIS